MIMGPNLRYLPGEYWDFYDHHLGLTHASLCEILAIKGFQIERCVDRFLPYTTQGANAHASVARQGLLIDPNGLENSRKAVFHCCYTKPR